MQQMHIDFLQQAIALLAIAYLQQATKFSHVLCPPRDEG